MRSDTLGKESTTSLDDFAVIKASTRVIKYIPLLSSETNTYLYSHATIQKIVRIPLIPLSVSSTYSTVPLSCVKPQFALLASRMRADFFRLSSLEISIMRPSGRSASKTQNRNL